MALSDSIKKQVKHNHPSHEWNFLVDGGEMGKLMQTHDWSTSPLGPLEGWPPCLKSAVAMILPAAVQIVMFWGQEYAALYNDAYAPTIGDKHPHALGRPAHEYWTELWDDLEPLLDRVRESGETVSAKDRSFYIERHGYPETVFFDISYSPIRDEDGTIAGVLCIVNETTERIQAEARQKQAEAALTKELQQKDEFLAIVSHELKTPVTSIKAYTQVLQRQFAKDGNEKAALQLGKMDAQLNKLTALIRDLLDVTKIDAGKLQFHEEYFAFDELIDEIVEQAQFITKHHIIQKQGHTNKTIYGDRDRVGQVLMNFLTNAIKYSPHAELILVKSEASNTDVTVCVQDFGRGIPKEMQDKVFERFYRVTENGKETYPGLGLGLYISDEFIKRLGGKIWLESKEGKGSSFYFSLPINK